MENKKIGILSFWDTFNYGGILQLYALSELLKDKGFEVQIIRYTSTKPYIFKSRKQKIVSFIYRKLFLNLVLDRKRRNKTNIFRNKMNLTNNLFNIHDINAFGFDSVIVGSDQVWNPRIIGNDISYLLPLDNSIKKISYAASFGDGEIDESWGEQCAKYISLFDYISVREETSKNILKTFFSKECNNIHVDIDPTLLLEANEWISKCIINTKRLIKKPYTLVYIMPGDNKIKNKMLYEAKKYSKKTNTKLIIVGDRDINRLKFWSSNKYGYGPNEFLNLILNSEFVFTNSFHGTAFSLNFNKEFLSFVNENSTSKKGRITCLLEKLDLKNRVINIHETNQKITDLDKINYEIVNKVLKSFRRESISNLITNLK